MEDGEGGRVGRDGGWRVRGREDGGRDENTCLVYKPCRGGRTRLNFTN